ncbi:IS1634 family transposase [Bradyrhizobium sp.]|uniref:IS1634 family transposase n=1 Tax=Bradyrhizobium sp. TaxID=376 RepID=UPI0025B89D01|nr:IS1634 family transposase [Bradyrhizobium sp.]MBV8839582.1 IS1634 family transposase [Alphaproteobacteria bacterium]MBV8919111.1 IS1634 family transposase [Bradyrhizobium sp.]
MFVREKRIGSYSYVYLVETVREDGRVKQRIIRNLGRKEEVERRGDLDRLARSAARLAQRSLVLSALDADGALQLACKRIGPPLLFERLWRDSQCSVVLHELLDGRGFGFPVERAVFLTVLHRLMVSGSDRACEQWREDYRIDGVADLQLHHLYRAMAWLGEELPEDEQAGRTLVPRCIKDLVEERLFACRRDLFSDLSVVFMDTTSLYFEGEGGESLGERGHSKDHRPQLNQMIVGVVLDQQGRPVCSQLWPGNTADVTTLIPVIDRLRSRFGIARVCVVADRGMVSSATIATLEQRGLDYILGMRERSAKEVREVVLADPAPSVPLVIPRAGRSDTELQAKEVMVGERRYIVCRNLSEAAQAARTRDAVLAALRAKLTQGDKALVGNSAYRRYLKTPDERHFQIDDARVAEDARYDGLHVLRTSTRLHPLEVMRRYRELLVVEQLFRSAKALLATRPIYHQTDAAIRGHVFCSFLALVLRKALEERLAAARLKPEWRDLLADLDRLQEITVVQDSKRLILRTPTTGVAGKAFQAVGVALPPNIQDAELPAAA